MKHPFRWAPGQALGHLLVTGQISKGAKQREDVYAVKMTCCDSNIEMTHDQIRERTRRLDAKTCWHCRKKPFTWEVPPPPLPEVLEWQPGQQLGPVTLLAFLGGTVWRIRWACCGKDILLTRHRITDILGKVRRGFVPKCRSCATRAAKTRYIEAVTTTPAPVAITAESYQPDWMVSPCHVWPRPPSLTQTPGVWGAQAW